MSHDRKLEVCVIGCGHMGQVHASNAASSPHLGVLTVSDKNAEYMNTLAASLGARTADLAGVFDGPKYDAYIVASPAHLHLTQLQQAARTGAYVFCEKPLATDMNDLAAAMPELKDHIKRIQIGFNRRFDPQMAALKEQLDAGTVGMVEQLHIISRDHKPPEIADLKNSAGLIAETAIHDFDLVRWLLGSEITTIECFGASLINPEYADLGHIDTATMVMISERGQQVVLQNSWRATNGYDQRVEAFGAGGRLNLLNPLHSTVVFENRAGQHLAEIADDWTTRYANSYALEMHDFLERAAGQQAVSPTVEDGYKASMLADCAQRSLDQGARVACSE